MLLHSDGFQVVRCHCILWRALFWHSPATKMKKNIHGCWDQIGEVHWNMYSALDSRHESISFWPQEAAFASKCYPGGKDKSAYEPSGSSGQSLSWFLQHEVTRSTTISTLPWMGCQSITGLPKFTLSSLVPIYTPGWREAMWK